jgi:hypothetical protein
MLIVAFSGLGIAVLLGSVLGIHHLRSAVPPRRLAAVHGLFGILGLAGLLLALQAGEPSPDRHGTESFGPIAAVLVLVAAAAGGGILASRIMMRRPPGILIAGHATLAVSGFVILAAYVFVR